VAGTLLLYSLRLETVPAGETPPPAPVCPQHPDTTQGRWRREPQIAIIGAVVRHCGGRAAGEQMAKRDALVRALGALLSFAGLTRRVEWSRVPPGT
jgi:hypothetical protein